MTAETPRTPLTAASASLSPLKRNRAGGDLVALTNEAARRSEIWLFWRNIGLNPQIEITTALMERKGCDAGKHYALLCVRSDMVNGAPRGFTREHYKRFLTKTERLWKNDRSGKN